MAGVRVLRAKEATKGYPLRLKKCRPHRARPFGAGLERQHGRRASPTADERLRSYEESRESYRELPVLRVQKKRDLKRSGGRPWPGEIRDARSL